MSDDAQKPEGGQETDLIGNLKQEMSRKLSSQEAKLNELAEANRALLSKLSAMTTPRAESREDDIDKMWYEDPKKAAAKIKQDTKAEIMAEVNRSQDLQMRTTQTLNVLVSDYPELNDNSHELTKRAVEIYNALPADEKTSPSAYKLAVKEAASDLGILPVKRRQTSDDGFTVSSTGSYQQKQGSKKSSKQDDIDPRTIAFAKMVGLNVDDPKTIENLKQRAKRTNWNRFE